MSIFSTIFEQGFSISKNVMELGRVINAHSDVHVVECANPEQAYIIACHELYERENEKGSSKIFGLPKLEEMIQKNIMTYIIPDSVPPIHPVSRIFAAISYHNVAILDSVANVIEFIQLNSPSEIIEKHDIVSAQNHIEFKFLKHIIPWIAYSNSTIPRIPPIPINQMVAVNYIEWFIQNVTIPQELQNNYYANRPINWIQPANQNTLKLESGNSDKNESNNGYGFSMNPY